MALAQSWTIEVQHQLSSHLPVIYLCPEDRLYNQTKGSLVPWLLARPSLQPKETWWEMEGREGRSHGVYPSAFTQLGYCGGFPPSTARHGSWQLVFSIQLSLWSPVCPRPSPACLVRWRGDDNPLTLLVLEDLVTFPWNPAHLLQRALSKHSSVNQLE